MTELDSLSLRCWLNSVEDVQNNGVCYLNRHSVSEWLKSVLNSIITRGTKISISDKIIAESKSALTEIMILKVWYFPSAALILTFKL